MSVEKIEKALSLLWNRPNTEKKESRERKKASQFPHTITLLHILLFLNGIYFKLFWSCHIHCTIYSTFLPYSNFSFLFFSYYNYNAINISFLTINFTIVKMVRCEVWTTYIDEPTTFFPSQLIVHYFNNCKIYCEKICVCMTIQLLGSIVNFCRLIYLFLIYFKQSNYV